MPIEDLNEFDRMLLRDMIKKIYTDSAKIITILENLEKIPQYVPSGKDMKHINEWAQREEEDSHKAARALVFVIFKCFESRNPKLREKLCKYDDEYRYVRYDLQTSVIF